MKALQEISEETCELEMTPMIDVTFLLLIFFILTLKFKVLEGKLSAYLPKDQGLTSELNEESEAVEIRIEVVPGQAGRRVFAGGEEAGEAFREESQRRFSILPGSRRLLYWVGPRRLTDRAGLERRLAELQRLDPDRRAVIDAGPGTFTGDVVGVLDSLVEAGFDRISFRAARDE